MSDRRGDQGAQLFPRRTLAGPSSREDAPPEPDQSDHAGAGATKPTRTGKARGRGGRGGRNRDGGGNRDGGPPTAALPRVEERPAGPDHPDQRDRPPRRGPEPPTPPSTPERDRPAVVTAPVPAAGTGRNPRRARLRIVRLDPWSVMKMAFALSIALAVVTVVAVAIVWSVLETAGVWESINSGVDKLSNPDAGEGFDVQQFVGLGRVMGLTMVVSLANVVLLTALATLAAFIHNLAAALLGGFEVTLAEDR